MKYEEIKDFLQRCEVHPDHQSGMITHQMLEDRLQEEIDELRAYIESQPKREWVGLTEQEKIELKNTNMPTMALIHTVCSLLKAQNT